ncbi:Uncharacterised protein [uncultured Clostridium sp.]|uniref:hypothetical protein n=1 Tax=uncultured Clostridium sp. TaxID=59620 RepID=UPI0008203BEC|nr:hypothetical protein [uncultured Clostridium sp.]SCK01529.1 Uncharacterised protein [uncultured Clostridium sp.]
MIKIERYRAIIEVLCRHYKINDFNLMTLLKNKECKYLFLLLLSEYGCLEKEKLVSELIFSSNKSINYNLKKAEEKLLINKQFRDNYSILEKTVKDDEYVPLIKSKIL